ncbi:hypothetical protein [Tepidanaerobacter syntrophicus]|uniref:hypothetical protein n=1 Tax=Tepidanaerobacter syntrophicus TaxID=224999 RepID=UPI001BD22F20|nr:hypothetical protein [Tepidanaerobacter syntrophicus]
MPEAINYRENDWENLNLVQEHKGTVTPCYLGRLGNTREWEEHMGTGNTRGQALRVI